MNNKSFYIAAIAAISISSNIDEASAQKMEKCYGIVKTGKNDCASADGRHTCAGYSKIDGGPNEWMLLPDGSCQNIVGASIISEHEKNAAKNESEENKI